MARKATRHTIGTVTIYQRNRHWHASYTAIGVRTRQALKVTNLKVAQQKAREIADMIERGEYVTLEDRREQRNMTFGGFVTEFKDKHKGWGDTTWRGAKGIIERYEDEWGHLPLSAINARTIESFITRCIDCDGITNATANRRLACLKTIFKMAIRWGLLVHNPAERIKTMKEEPKVPRALSEAETQLFLAELPDYAQVLAIMAIDTGMRKSELYRLQWQDIDFERRQTVVRCSKNNTFRVIPMTNRVYDTLQVQRQKGIIPFVLVGKDGNPEQSVRDVLSTVGKKVGIGHVHLHMLRHTFATLLRERGVALDRIMELLGHKTMAMTLRYAKSSPTQLQDAIESLNISLPTRQTQHG